MPPTVQHTTQSPEQLAILRYDGNSRLATEWNSLDRDPELWAGSNNCLVYLHHPEETKGSAAFLVSSDCIDDITLAKSRKYIDTEEQELQEVLSSLMSKAHKSVSRNGVTQEIYIPAPPNSHKEASVDWHITTRNYFAFRCGKALVGNTLGQALVSLYDRLKLWKPHNSNNEHAMIVFAKEAGYCNFAHCPDYALGLLQFAEHVHNEPLWVEAFSHCCGMYDILSSSYTFLTLPSALQLLVEKTSSSMRSYLEGTTSSLTEFLHEELSSLPLGSNAVTHLEQFRRFLQEFYVRKFGYWPPNRLFTKSIFRSMLSDFTHLFDYLVDNQSSHSLTDQRLASGGICVLQNIQEFDARNGVDSLAHPHPLLPRVSGNKKLSTQKAFSALNLGHKYSNSSSDSSCNALAAATNRMDDTVLSAPLVKEYQKYEQEITSATFHKLSLAEGRKVRWLLIYCTLQLLKSVLRAPPQVEDTETPTYFLCCDTTRLPSWRPILVKNRTDSNDRQAKKVIGNFSAADGAQNTPLSSPLRTPRVAVAPDCQTDNYNQHMEVSSPPSWRTKFSTKEPSAMAFEELRKQSLAVKKAKDQKIQNKHSNTQTTSISREVGATKAVNLAVHVPSAAQIARHSRTSTRKSSRSGKGSISSITKQDRADSIKSGSASLSPTSTLPGSRASSTKKEIRIQEPGEAEATVSGASSPEVAESGAIPLPHTSPTSRQARSLPAATAGAIKSGPNKPASRSAHHRNLSEILPLGSLAGKKSHEPNKLTGNAKTRTNSISSSSLFRSLSIKKT